MNDLLTPVGAFSKTLFVIETMALNFVHWAITYIYIKASIEMNAILDKRVHMDSQIRLLEIEKQKRCLFICNYISIFFCVIESFTWAFNVELVYLGLFIRGFLDLFFLILWASALCSIATKVKNADNVMPNKRMFCIHGVLLGAFLFFWIAYSISIYIAYRMRDDLKKLEVWLTVCLILFTLSIVF